MCLSVILPFSWARCLVRHFWGLVRVFRDPEKIPGSSQVLPSVGADAEVCTSVSATSRWAGGRENTTGAVGRLSSCVWGQLQIWEVLFLKNHFFRCWTFEGFFLLICIYFMLNLFLSRKFCFFSFSRNIFYSCAAASSSGLETISSIFLRVFLVWQGELTPGWNLTMHCVALMAHLWCFVLLHLFNNPENLPYPNSQINAMCITNSALFGGSPLCYLAPQLGLDLFTNCPVKMTEWHLSLFPIMSFRYLVLVSGRWGLKSLPQALAFYLEKHSKCKHSVARKMVSLKGEEHTHTHTL